MVDRKFVFTALFLMLKIRLMPLVCFDKICISLFQHTVALLGYGIDETDGPFLELAYNYGVTEYDKGNAYAQVG